MEDTDFIKLAVEASKNAYVPYSHFPIGAVVKMKSGRIFTGCNIENASFGLTNCGERTAIFKAISEGCSDFESITIYGQTKNPVSPCGACRQVMAEFFEESACVTLVSSELKTVVMTVKDLLPYSFTDLS